LPGDDSTEPLWTTRYPAFPIVLVVLANGTRRALEGRRGMVLALLAEEDVDEVRIDMCLLEDLITDGPFGAIVRSVREPNRPVDWLGR
jgi:hypothetical protein